MRNIYELIGIIKGINFDGIINEKEVLRLRSWVDKNRNLAYDKKQINLIRLVDTVLEDNIIDNDERETMLDYCNKYLNDAKDDTSKIYELNGIIEGIVCDGEVNESEIYRLKEWMNENSDCIRGHKTSESLCKILDDILSDGIVTQNEQEQLLHFLSDRISSVQFETKLEHLKKQVKAGKNIGIDLIDILDNEDVIDEIHNQAESKLGKILNSYSGSCGSDNEIVFISLVLIGMLHYDGNYYDSVNSTYQNLYKYYSEQKIEGLIRSILSKYRSDETEKISKSRIINVVLSNAIVPSHFLKSFFEFVYDIYRLNFEYNLSDELEDDFRFVYEGLSKSMGSNGDELKLNVTKKTYKLIKSTKELIANNNNIDNINAVIKLSIIVIKLIDKKIWNKEIKIFNPYLKEGYNSWIATLNNDRRISSSRHKSKLHSRWEPKYVLSQNNIYIVPPIHRVNADYDYSDICIVVYNDNTVIFKNEKPDIREIIGGYQISINKIKLCNPIGKISYKLLAGNKIIYDSKDKLFRDFIVFKQDGTEIKNNTNYSGTAILCLNSANTDFKSFYTDKNYLLSSQNVKLGSVLMIENYIFSFSSFIKPGIFGDKLQNHYIVDTHTNEQISVYRSIKYLMFENEINNTDIEIVINSQHLKLSDFTYTKSSRDSADKYVVNLDITDSGIHTIKVFTTQNRKRTRLFSSVFALDTELKTDMLKLDDESFLVYVSSELFSSVINKDIVISEFYEDWLKFNILGQEYSYRIPFQFDIYRIDSSKWKSMNNEIWIGEINQDSILDLYGSATDELMILTSVGSKIENTIQIKNHGIIQRIPIGFLNSYKTSYDYIVLIFLKNGKKQNMVFCYNRTVLDTKKTDIIYNPITKCLDIIPVIYGQGNVYFTISKENGDIIYKSSSVKNGLKEPTPQLPSFEELTISFFEKGKGLSLRKNRILESYKRKFYARGDFIGRSFRIANVYFDQVVNGGFSRKKLKFYNVYVQFTEILDDGTFVGKIFAETYRGIFNYYNINPVEIEICSDVIDGNMELSITKDGDGLLLDFEHNGILNSLDDNKAIDIISYTINID